MKKFYFKKERNSIYFKVVEREYSEDTLWKKQNEASRNYCESFNPNDKYDKDEISRIIEADKLEKSTKRINEFIKNNINNKTALAYLEFVICIENGETWCNK